MAPRARDVPVDGTAMGPSGDGVHPGEDVASAQREGYTASAPPTPATTATVARIGVPGVGDEHHAADRGFSGVQDSRGRRLAGTVSSPSVHLPDKVKTSSQAAGGQAGADHTHGRLRQGTACR